MDEFNGTGSVTKSFYPGMHCHCHCTTRLYCVQTVVIAQFVNLGYCIQIVDAAVGSIGPDGFVLQG